ncbi:glycosyltransferase family 2 protein [Marinilactibacillus kalidii]|uniref:glycosyltransferase family 2 protein n=1 Tax=Marinilactibacillus kalidii TaxID=2820274 RepID=UPI001ABE4625|nr:glycosyltransferase family 2 protein [Marinilactibacillus kalidii]
MKLSVVVPVYNLESYIDQCIDSLLNQTYSDYELILINDGSTDNSLEICNQYAQKDSRIRVVDKKNEGISLTRNRGIQEASCEYIFFLDGDDWIHQETLKSYYDIIKQDQTIDLVFGRMSMFFDGDDQLKPDEFIVENELVYQKDGKSSFMAIVDKIGFMRLGVRGLFRRQFLIENDIYFKPNMYSEDVEWMMNCVLHAKNCASNVNPYYNYRGRRKGSLVNTPSINKALDVYRIYAWWVGKAEEEKDKIFKQYFFNEIAERYINTFIEFSYQFVPSNIDMGSFHKEVNKNKKVIRRSNRKTTLHKGLPLVLFGSRITAKLYYNIKKQKNKNADPSYF